MQFGQWNKNKVHQQGYNISVENGMHHAPYVFLFRKHGQFGTQFGNAIGIA